MELNFIEGRKLVRREQKDIQKKMADQKELELENQDLMAVQSNNRSMMSPSKGGVNFNIDKS
jgi:hypothetical protein